MITGKTLIEWGFNPGAWFGDALREANSPRNLGLPMTRIYDLVAAMEPPPPAEIPYRTNTLPFEVFLEPENDVERENLALVTKAMDELMRTPTVVSGAVMPDACPAGTIPVGGVVATKDAIHPGFHSADVCCSMAITVFKREMDLKRLLDVAHSITHFGPGGRKSMSADQNGQLAKLGFDGDNPFLRGIEDIAGSNMMTQGDGNHFLFVGRLRSTGQPAIVTHHGSRGVGALIYKRGMVVAKRHTAIHSPKTPAGAAWIDANSDDGRNYWEALQFARRWTKENHFRIHDCIQHMIGNKIIDRFWNEHNFVFRRDDGLFYHAKGATPSFAGFSPDDDGRTLIPMNMAEPILITRHTNNSKALGFAPHGAGRNMSRTAYLRNVVGDRPFEELTPKGVDVRFWLGTPDLSELPGAYKNALQVVDAINKHNLAEVVDFVDPYGSIMAGEMNWRRK